MYPIDPGDQWGTYVVIGASQTEDYEPLYARIHPVGQTITRWRFTEKERRDIADGRDLYLAVMQGGNPLQPLAPWVDEG